MYVCMYICIYIYIYIYTYIEKYKWALLSSAILSTRRCPVLFELLLSTLTDISLDNMYYIYIYIWFK